MEAYIYNAGIYCEECGTGIRQELSEGPPLSPLDREDSEYYPQGPYPDGGGEADCPQNCGGCGLFLGNPLTKDGEDYVRDAISLDTAMHFSRGWRYNAMLKEWREFYNHLEQEN